MDEDKARQLKLMLSGVTKEGGTGFQARIQGFPVAGKTGTAQRIDSENGGYQVGRYLSSFAGFLPVNDPKFVIYVAVDDPMGEFGRGATAVAVPLFKQIAEYALRKSRTEPSYIENDAIVISADSKSSEPKEPAITMEWKSIENAPELKKIPKLQGLTLKEVLKKFEGHNVDLRLEGKGRFVKGVSPKQGRSFREGQKVRLRF